MVDTNIVLHQMDVLEHSVFANVIIPQTVMEEAKNRNSVLYNRLRFSFSFSFSFFFFFSLTPPSRELTSSHERSVFVFSNQHHRKTAIERGKVTTKHKQEHKIQNISFLSFFHSFFFSFFFLFYREKLPTITTTVQSERFLFFLFLSQPSLSPSSSPSPLPLILILPFSI